jgi:nitrogen fixation NifU-like protein
MINPRIVKIASNTQYAGLKNIYTHKSSVKNKLCGDKIILELVANKTKVNSIRYKTESCILCEASASLLANKIKNYSIKNIKKDINGLKKKIINKDYKIPLKFKEFRYLIDKNNFNRVNCVILPLEALLKAFEL